MDEIVRSKMLMMLTVLTVLRKTRGILMRYTKTRLTVLRQCGNRTLTSSVLEMRNAEAVVEGIRNVSVCENEDRLDHLAVNMEFCDGSSWKTGEDHVDHLAENARFRAIFGRKAEITMDHLGN